MLSKECIYLLNYIRLNATNEYLIISVNEIILEFPLSYAITKEAVSEMILTLKNNGYISVKYNDGESLCLKCNEKGIVFLESNEKCEITKKDTNFKIFGLCFFASLLGAFLGVLLILFLSKI